MDRAYPLDLEGHLSGREDPPQDPPRQETPSQDPPRQETAPQDQQRQETADKDRLVRIKEEIETPAPKPTSPLVIIGGALLILWLLRKR